jgi:hypothetical protein
MTADVRAIEEFDLDRYLRASKRVDLSGVAWDRVREHPLSEAEARCLAYMTARSSTRRSWRSAS